MFIRVPVRSKTRAFTLLEIMISLVLSFFIVGILYLSYHMMENQFRNEYQKQLSSLVLLKSGLEMDFFHADTIIAEQKQLFIFKNGKKSRYQFMEDAILKEVNLENDTLFKGECSANFELVEKNNWVQRLTISITTEKEDVQMSFRKQYRPNQKLKDKEVSFEY